MAKSKVSYRCTSCGYESLKWLGRCPDCETWSSLQEETKSSEPRGAQKTRSFRLPTELGVTQPVALGSIAEEPKARLSTGMSELDRVLGGGLVAGSLVLVGGDPGIGKSTLLLQALGHLSDGGQKTLYVSGEESLEQIRLRASRLRIEGNALLLLPETRAELVTAAIEAERPAVVVVDSIQTIYDSDIPSAPGSVTQIREVSARILYQAKSLGVPVFLVGHVTKHGEIAGPRILEHMVDTVLYFERSGASSYRILRAHKNRFGSTNEIGVFEMNEGGLLAVENPSELFLSERPTDAPGSVVLPAIEGTRPVLVEVQALVSPTNFGNPRRTCLGFDSNRAALLVAILERRVGLQLLGCDVFVNIAGGLTIDDPSADLAVSVALASSLRGQPVDRRTVLFGEVGLAGELRAVAQPEIRLKEAAKLGFSRAVVPKACLKRLEVPKGMEVIGVSKLEEALSAAGLG